MVLALYMFGLLAEEPGKADVGVNSIFAHMFAIGCEAAQGTLQPDLSIGKLAGLELGVPHGSVEVS